MRLALSIVLPLAAAGETFEDVAARAEAIGDARAAVQPLLWKCAEAEPFSQKRCELLKRRLTAQQAARTFRMTAEPEAVRVVTKDRPPTAEVALRGCVACETPLVLEDGLVGKGFVTTRRPKAIGARPGVLGKFELTDLDVARQAVALDGKSPAEWRDAAAPHLRAEIVFRPSAAPAWFVGVEPRHEGVLVEILAWRIFDRCTGAIVASSHPAQPVEGVQKTEATCPGYAPPAAEGPEPPPEVLPKSLGREALQRTFEGVREEVLICYEKFGVPGYAPTRIVIGGADGKVKAATVGGKFENTPTAECIAQIVHGLTFPRFMDKELVVNWQFFLR
jgi:hypothetical protein